jgi:4,5-dihydroxyphthalate decarboxylase
MAQVTLRAVTRTQGSTADLKNGTISPQRCALAFEEVPDIVRAFRRMVRSLEFDVAEMAITTYLCAKSFGAPFTALPVFLVRGLHHGAVVGAAGPGITRPADLEGREVGVNRGYTVTTGVWARAILQEEHGVDLSRVTWVPTGEEHVAEYHPPPNVRPAAAGQDLAGLVTTGSVAAGVGITARWPGLVPLIPDPEEASLRALRQRGLYPINHTVVVKDELLAADPGLAADLFMAYAEAKNTYVERLGNGAIADPAPADLMYRQVMDATGADPLPYGIEPNRAVLEQLIRHAVSQRILPAPVAVEGLFADATRHMTATL